MQPRWYQTESVDATWEHFNTRDGAPLIVLPTGAGKSIVLAMLAEQALQKHGRRSIILAHRKELLTQNADKLHALLPNRAIGIYSAGLKRRDTDSDIVCAGIQSAYSRAAEFGHRDLVIVDEAHLIPKDGDGMYQQFLREMDLICPHARLVGLTATPYRCSTGAISGSGQMFSRICFEAGTGQLIDEGFLCPLTNKPAKHQTDTSAIKICGGEFVTASMGAVFGHTDEVTAACGELVRESVDRRSIIVFCSGVDHAQNVADTIHELTGEECGTATGETGALEREATLRRFSSGELRWLTNCDVLTTGFDNPRIDCVAILRATMSPGLFAQIVGRGLRVHPDKTNCLVLDFGGNIERHGPLDDPDYGRASVFSRGTGGPLEMNGRGKPCLNCGIDCPPAARECECGFVFPVKSRHETQADSENDLIGSTPKHWTVIEARALEHSKRNAPEAPTTLRVIYKVVPADRPEDDGSGFGNLEGEQVSEWVCFNHEGFARQKAEQWWSERSTAAIPESVADALMCWDSVLQPRTITTVRDGRFQRIASYEFDEQPPEEWALAVPNIDEDELPF